MIESYKYFENNIKFRITSSRLLAEYKEMQEFNLKEMVFGNYPFPKEVRDIYLLKLDLWFRFAIQLEEKLIRLEDSAISKEEVSHILEMANLTEARYTEIMDDHKQNPNFDTKIYRIWRECHKELYNYFAATVKEVEGFDTVEAFSHIIKHLIVALETTLYELFEVINITRNFSDEKINESRIVGFDAGKTYLCFTSICKEYKAKTCKNLIIERLKIYLTFYDIQTVALRDYSESKMPIEAVKTIMEELNKLGVELDIVSTLGKPE